MGLFKTTEAEHAQRCVAIRGEIAKHQASIAELDRELRRHVEAIADIHDPSRAERRAAALAAKLAPIDQQIHTLTIECDKHSANGNYPGALALDAKIQELTERRHELAQA